MLVMELFVTIAIVTNGGLRSCNVDFLRWT